MSLPPSQMLRHSLPLLFIVLAAALHAQSVRWQPNAGTLAINQLSELSLVFEECEPQGSIPLPDVPGLAFQGQPNRSESTSFSVINGNASRSRTITYTYRVRPSERRTVTIPAFGIETDKGRQFVASATYEVGDATVGQENIPLSDIAQSRFTLPAGQVWAGEVFPLNYTLHVARRFFYQLGSDLEWNSSPLTIEPWAKPELAETSQGGATRISVLYKTRAYARAPGTVSLNKATQLVNLSTGSSAFSVFARMNLVQQAVTSEPASLTIRPLPSPAPAGFNGAVGSFTLDSKVVPAAAAVGDPITWTLTLEGAGNWPDIPGLPPRSVSKDFRFVQPQPKRTSKDGALFEAALAEDIVLIPTKPGAYTLGPVNYTIFNPATGAYETLATEAVTIQVTAAAGQDAPAPSSPAQAGTPASPSAAGPSSASAPPAVAALPRDPLPPSGHASAPLPRATLAALSLSALLVPAAVWFVLALRRARATDPARPLREARIRMKTTLDALAASPSDAAMLRRWQRDAALLWRLPQAVPVAASLPDETWSALWAEADRSLYGAAPLPADWPARASAALAARRVPAFSPFQLLLPRNLLPLLAVLASLAASHASLAAETGADAYGRADFTAAEAAWLGSLAADPGDWAARHNLALALMQQNRSAEAAGHALAAFLRQPQDASVRWHLDYAFRTAGITPTEIKPFLIDSPAATLARQGSPLRWQALLVAASWLAAAALAAALCAAYKKRRRPWLVLPALGFAVLLAAASLWSLHTYGVLKDTRAVMVVKPATLRSIPTELETPQKTTTLPIGAIAIADRTFLGWQRLVFGDGQTGWTRTDTIVPLWH